MPRRVLDQPRKPVQGIIHFDTDGEGIIAAGAEALRVQQSEPPAREDEHTGSGNASNSEPEPLCFISLGSGSSGNCAYLGTASQGLLIDAGVRYDLVMPQLERNGISPNMIKGIILTHDHADHIRAVYKLVRSNKHVRVFCTPRLMHAIMRYHNMSSHLKDYHAAVWKEIPFALAGMNITPFETSHDAIDNTGFLIERNGEKFVVATDMGRVTERAMHYIAQANYLMIESNYDLMMLRNGRYPAYLKARIQSDKGHLDNTMTADTLKAVAGKHLKWVMLCHLSNDNNKPEIAHATALEALQEKGLTVGDGSYDVDNRHRDTQLVVLPRHEASPWFTLTEP